MKDAILAIFMRADLNMSRGKIAVQAGHAVAHMMKNSTPEAIEAWFTNLQTKIVLCVNSEKELNDLVTRCEANTIPHHLVRDAGKTEIEPGSVTCLAVGIESRKRISKITQGFPTLK